uniref:Ubiquitin-like protease family profile domain-containing protein n=1 Tax=Panagrolaimus davidi TaxID=227884 RepID=A0A914R303_9BILA
MYPTLTVTTTTYQYAVPPQAVLNQSDDRMPVSRPLHYSAGSAADVVDSYVMMPDKKHGSSYKHSTPPGNLETREQKRILLKYSIAIYESDMASLRGWLSDAIVNFAAMHLYENLPNNVKQEFVNKLCNVMMVPQYPVQNQGCPKMGFGGDCGIYAIEYLNSIFFNICHHQPWYNFEPMKNADYMKSRRSFWKREIERLAKEEEGTPKILEIFEDERQPINSQMDGLKTKKVFKNPPRSEMDCQPPIYVIDEDKPRSKRIPHDSRSHSITTESNLPYKSSLTRYHDGKDIYYGPKNIEIKGQQSRRSTQSSKSFKTEAKRSRSASSSSSHKCPRCGHDPEEQSKHNKNKKELKGFLDELNCFGKPSKEETRC